MNEITPLDEAALAMQAAPNDDAARLRFFERLAESELFLLLKDEAEGDQIAPLVFPVDGTEFVLVFDREERLAAFVGGPAPLAALSGRAIVNLLTGQGIGLGVNLQGGAASEQLLPPEAVSWLAETLAQEPDTGEAQIEELYAPGGLPEAVVAALDAKLALSAGMARNAYLAEARYEGGRRGHVLAFMDAASGAEAALAQAAQEALVFSGVEVGELDVVFLSASDPRLAGFAKVGLRFELPKPEAIERAVPIAPGSNPDKPPRLR